MFENEDTQPSIKKTGKMGSIKTFFFQYFKEQPKNNKLNYVF